MLQFVENARLSRLKIVKEEWERRTADKAQVVERRGELRSERAKTRDADEIATRSVTLEPARAHVVREAARSLHSLSIERARAERVIHLVSFGREQ